jgi:hypothetical protein
MPAPVTSVDVVSKAGGGGPNQDRVRATSQCVFVLDGASAQRRQRLDGGGYAERLADHLVQAYEDAPDRTLPAIVRSAIQAVTQEIRDDQVPSSTVTIARSSETALEVLVLGDSTAVIFLRDGRTEVLCDDRLNVIGGPLRQAYQEALRQGGGFGPELRERLARLQAEQMRMRNRRGGFWIAATDPEAADEALHRRFAAEDVEAVLLATDGAADGVSVYQLMTWREALQFVRRNGVGSFVAGVEAAEQSDSDARRWPRSKPHDDKSVALVAFPDLVQHRFGKHR